MLQWGLDKKKEGEGGEGIVDSGIRGLGGYEKMLGC